MYVILYCAIGFIYFIYLHIKTAINLIKELNTEFLYFSMVNQKNKLYKSFYYFLFMSLIWPVFLIFDVINLIKFLHKNLIDSLINYLTKKYLNTN